MINLEHSLRHCETGIGTIEYHLLQIELANIKSRPEAKPLVKHGNNYTRAFNTCILLTTPLLNKPFIMVDENGHRDVIDMFLQEYIAQEESRKTYDKVGVNMRAKIFV